MVIEHDNILYIRDLSPLGGVETFIWEMVKKYKKYDIAVVYKTADPKQLERLKKYCKCYEHKNQRIKCKVAIINWDTSIIDYITDTATIYQVVHADYTNPAYTWKPPTHLRIKEYIGVTKYVMNGYKKLTGFNNVTYGYNPLTIEKEEKPIVLVSATRLSPIKGKARMEKLVAELDKANINYIWYIFTNDRDEINSKNVIYMKPRLDVSKWISNADYIVQLSDTEACSYTINESLYRNIPVIVTPLPYLEEIGVRDGINAWILNFDCSNIKHIVDNITQIPKFKFEHLKDRYDMLLIHTPSHFEEDKKMKIKVEALDTYEKYNIIDNELKRVPKAGEQFEVTKERLDILLGENDSGRIYVKIIEPVKEEEKAILPKKEVKRKKNK